MMEAISLLDDLDGLWALIVADAEANECGKSVLAEIGNIAQVNLACSADRPGSSLICESTLSMR